jgi:hypothetical protein
MNWADLMSLIQGGGWLVELVLYVLHTALNKSIAKSSHL